VPLVSGVTVTPLPVLVVAPPAAVLGDELALLVPVLLPPLPVAPLLQVPQVTWQNPANQDWLQNPQFFASVQDSLVRGVSLHAVLLPLVEMPLVAPPRAAEVPPLAVVPPLVVLLAVVEPPVAVVLAEVPVLLVAPPRAEVPPD
jgi:hypothetical protein